MQQTRPFLRASSRERDFDVSLHLADEYRGRLRSAVRRPPRSLELTTRLAPSLCRAHVVPVDTVLKVVADGEFDSTSERYCLGFVAHGKASCPNHLYVSPVVRSSAVSRCRLVHEGRRSFAIFASGSDMRFVLASRNAEVPCSCVFRLELTLLHGERWCTRSLLLVLSGGERGSWNSWGYLVGNRLLVKRKRERDDNFAVRMRRQRPGASEHADEGPLTETRESGRRRR